MILRENSGFTLIELLVVLTIVSIMSILVVPSATRFLRDDRKEIQLLLEYFNAVFDDAVIHNRHNVMRLHLPGPPEDEDVEWIPGTITTTIYHNGTYENHPRSVLSRFTIKGDPGLLSVALPGMVVESGIVEIPFHPDGSTIDAIIHFTLDEQDWSFRLYRYQKEPEVHGDHAHFQ